MSLTTGFGNTFAKALMELLLGKTAYAGIATWYAALFTTDPTDDDGTTLVEVTTGQLGSYARVVITNNTTNFPASSIVAHVQTLLNGVDIDWGTFPTGSGATIVGVGLYDAATVGNLGPWGPLTLSRSLVAGDGFKITAGNLTFTMS